MLSTRGPDHPALEGKASHSLRLDFRRLYLRYQVVCRPTCLLLHRHYLPWNIEGKTVSGKVLAIAQGTLCSWVRAGVSITDCRRCDPVLHARTIRGLCHAREAVRALLQRLLCLIGQRQGMAAVTAQPPPSTGQERGMAVVTCLPRSTADHAQEMEAVIAAIQTIVLNGQTHTSASQAMLLNTGRTRVKAQAALRLLHFRLPATPESTRYPSQRLPLRSQLMTHRPFGLSVATIA